MEREFKVGDKVETLYYCRKEGYLKGTITEIKEGVYTIELDKKIPIECLGFRSILFMVETPTSIDRIQIIGSSSLVPMDDGGSLVP